MIISFQIVLIMLLVSIIGIEITNGVTVFADFFLKDKAKTVALHIRLMHEFFLLKHILIIFSALMLCSFSLMEGATPFDLNAVLSRRGIVTVLSYAFEALTLNSSLFLIRHYSPLIKVQRYGKMIDAIKKYMDDPKALSDRYDEVIHFIDENLDLGLEYEDFLKGERILSVINIISLLCSFVFFPILIFLPYMEL